MNKTKVLPRREFLKNASLATGLLILPSHVLGREGNTSPNSKLNVASIGIGNMGWTDLNRIAATGVNIVGLCDVNSNNLQNGLKKFTSAKGFKDYREMLDKLGKEIDAVSVSTPDHFHFTAAMAAMQLGKHVYVQKPMAHTVDQCRRMNAAAKKYNVVTQMGNQGHSEEHIRVAKEWYEAGMFGEVKEIRTWTNRAGDRWPQGFDELPPEEKVPANLDWDLWLGPAKKVPYRKNIAPFKWRGFYDYGCGALGDMAVHIFDPANYILDLGAPTKIEVDLFGAKPTRYSFPLRSKLTYYFPAKGKRGPVKLIWQDGPDSKPEVPEGLTLDDNGGSLFYGSKEIAHLGSWGNSFNISGTKEHFEELREKAPPKTLERIRGGHYKNWTDAILNKKEATSCFEYAAPFTEMVLIGTIAQRLGENLEWDARAGKFTGNAAANALLKAPSPRSGFDA